MSSLHPFEAVITVNYHDHKLAKALQRSLGPDNVPTPKGLTVKSVAVGGKLVSKVTCDGRFETFLSTMNDLLGCLRAAEKVIEEGRRHA